MPLKLKPVASPTEDADYMEFLSTVQLVGLGLKSSEASIDRNIYSELVEEKKPVRRLSEKYASTDVGKDYFDVEGRFKITVADEARTGLLIQFVFEVHMHAKGPVDPQMAERFANSDLRFILLPYARQSRNSRTTLRGIETFLRMHHFRMAPKQRSPDCTVHGMRYPRRAYTDSRFLFGCTTFTSIL